MAVVERLKQDSILALSAENVAVVETVSGGSTVFWFVCFVNVIPLARR